MLKLCPPEMSSHIDEPAIKCVKTVVRIAQLREKKQEAG